MTINYLAEAGVREACDKAGVLPAAQEEFIIEFRAGLFNGNSIEAWIEDRRINRPIRWGKGGSSAEHNELFVEAFGPQPNFTKQGQVVALIGETAAAEIAAQFGTTLGGTKPGTVPEKFKTKTDGGDHSGNPWAKLRNPDGSTNKTVEAEVGRMIASLGIKKCEAMAKAAGKTITGLPLRT